MESSKIHNEKYGTTSVAKLLFDILRFIATHDNTYMCRKDMKQVEIGQNK